MNPYLSSSSLKRIAKGQLLGRYSSVIFIFLLHMLCLVSLQMLVSLVLAPTNIIKFILYYAALYLVYIVSGFFKAGEAYVYLKVASNQPVTVNDLFYCFRGESNRTSTSRSVWLRSSFLRLCPQQSTICSFQTAQDCLR